MAVVIAAAERVFVCMCMPTTHKCMPGLREYNTYTQFEKALPFIYTRSYRVNTVTSHHIWCSTAMRPIQRVNVRRLCLCMCWTYRCMRHMWLCVERGACLLYEPELGSPCGPSLIGVKVLHVEQEQDQSSIRTYSILERIRSKGNHFDVMRNYVFPGANGISPIRFFIWNVWFTCASISWSNIPAFSEHFLYYLDLHLSMINMNASLF